MSEEHRTLIALPTTKTPETESSSALVAIAALTPQRAQEILEQMKHVTRMARRWVGISKLSSYDGNVFFVPAQQLRTPPPPTDFRVLEPGFTTPIIAQVTPPQIGIIPGAVIWETFDAENRFLISSMELDAHVLEAIARGITLNPGQTSEGLQLAMPAQPIIDRDPRWEERLM